MISKIHKICGVGRFKDFKPTQAVELSELSIIFAENGRGKSTLAAILRSISNGNLDELGRRTTIGADSKSIVMCRDDGSKIAYSTPGTRWSQTIDDLLVFDETFVHENVSIGPLVDIDQRRNLNTVILGSTARQLSQEVKNVKAAIKARNQEIRATKQAIESKIQRPASSSVTPMSFKEFLQIQLQPGLESQLEQQKRHVEQLRNASEVTSHREFVKVEVPEFPIDELERLLTFSIEDIEANAEARVQEHLRKFSNDSLENWIEQGTGFPRDTDDDCPYCGQPLRKSSLIAHYKAYFSEAYKTLKSDIKEFAHRRLQFDSKVHRVNRALADNAGLLGSWQTEIDGLAGPIVDFEEVRLALTNLLDHTEILLREKANRPLDPIELSAGFRDAYGTWNQVCGQVSEYNRQHNENNAKICKHKQELGAGNLEEAEWKLLYLTNASIRESDEVSTLCDKYSCLEIEQKNDNRSKDDIQARINQESKATYISCGVHVNKFLARLNADFTITNLRQRRDGTTMQAEFHIALLGAEIPASDGQTAEGGQSYKTTLSEGDRRTLALAFFLARIEARGNLGNKIFVFDDPVTSMDDNRSSVTADLILEVCKKPGQVIVLSHRIRFLRNFWIKYKRKEDRHGCVTLLEVCPKEGDISFSEIRQDWNIKQATESEFNEDIRYIIDYVNNSPKTDKRNAAIKLRVILQSHYESRYPDEFTENLKQFGDFIEKAASCNQTSSLYALKVTDVSELKRLNEATSTFHHSSPLDLEESELRQLCKDTLNLIGRRY